MSCKSIVTISREFGSGGREIGIKLAKRLGIDFYDKELISLAAKESGIDPALFERIDEHAANSLLYSLSMGMFNFGQTGFSPRDQISVNDQLYLLQHKIIKQLAEKPCVIVGRCADYILRDKPNCINVFIHADIDYRMERAKKVHNIPENKVEAVVRKTDKTRSNYYQFYTEHKWGLASNYHLCINSGKMSEDRIVDVLCNYTLAYEQEEHKVKEEE
ncbi:AAA family ATPase [Oscillospiraceae bacterium LCP25S3_E10]|nr:cytidylate kinase-like family protein [Ruminococcus sp.]MDD6447083.1 cytidylate kinase-like family protein [Ruminococcus sp.]MDY2855745.1 cytidylate kinase-like family protein [Oscillospiraceae bacterium]